MTAELMIKTFETVEVFFMEDGWFNATAVAIKHGKNVNDWTRSDDAFRYGVELAKLLNSLNHPPGGQLNEMIQAIENTQNKEKRRVLIVEFLKTIGLVKIKRGSPENGGGTWMHPKLGVKFARWLSVKFELWCDQQIEVIIQRINSEQRPNFPVELHPVLHFLVVGQEEDSLMKQTRNTYTAVLDTLGCAAAAYKRCLTNNVSNILIGMPVKPFRRLHGIPAGSQRRTRLFYDSDLRRTMDEIERVSCRRLKREKPTSFDTIQDVVYEIARAARQYALVQGIELTEHVPQQELQDYY